MARLFSFQPYTVHYVLVLCVGFLLALISTPLGRRLGIYWGIADHPGGRRKHQGAISRLGGLGLAVGFFGAVALSQIAPIPTSDPNESLRFWGLMGGGLWMFLLGLADDRFDFSPRIQYMGYFVAAIIATVTLIILERFNNPFTNTTVVLPVFLYVPVTIFWMTGMTVTVNWLDGLDGLAAGVTAIVSAILAIHMVRVGQYSIVPLALALLGAALGFLVYNVPPARVFMGSNGSFFLGYLLGALSLIAGARVATVLLVMGIPVLDVAWTIVDRLRHARHASMGDRRHLHYRLKDAGFSTRVIVFAYWGFCALFGILALLLSSRLYKLLALLILGGLMLGVSIYLGLKDK
ncbi:MAG: undecaprenyl/decaprenyl-phosphate alpha-N-acetylglucosaminyl 1-phosphate transferase [Anaerolineae bacterium]|nr:undecaprenyl/decaprenyl-phosphate alpha-N-acetylglucosaminyl 1-phosphate transferase [Anaerolineae bacterium]